METTKRLLASAKIPRIGQLYINKYHLESSKHFGVQQLKACLAYVPPCFFHKSCERFYKHLWMLLLRGDAEPFLFFM